jgi:acetolactate synthase-1/2/3 large subunit
MLGMHGMACANMAVQNADLIVAIGMRFDDRATANTRDFAPNARIIHIDIDPAEIGKNVPIDIPIVGDVKNVLRAMNKEIERRDHLDWLSQLDKWRYEHPLGIRQNGLLPQYVVQQIYEATQGDAIIVTGVGQNQMWAAQHFTYIKPNSLISSGGLGTMGFELPAAIGAKVGCPEEMVWCIAGDGGIQMTIQELATIAQENIAVKIAIINNGYLGMVRQWQDLFYHRRYVDTQLWNPDFVKIAEAYDIPGLRVKYREEVASAIQRAMDYPGPFLIDFVVEPEENVYPMVPPGESLAKILEMPKPEILETPEPGAVSNF